MFMIKEFYKLCLAVMEFETFLLTYYSLDHIKKTHNVFCYTNSQKLNS